MNKSRFAGLMLGLAVVASLVSGCGDKPTETANPTHAESTNPPTDAKIITSVRNDIAAIEDQFINQQKQFADIFGKAIKEKKLNNDQTLKPIADLLLGMSSTLDQSANVGIPDIANVDAKRHITEAVEAHKKWAITNQRKILALANGKLKLAQQLHDHAEELAIQEALALVMAYQAVGLQPE